MKTRLASLAVLLCVVATGAFAQQVNVDWQRGTDFSKFKTYAWEQSQNPIRDPLWDQRVVGMIDAQLASKGLQKVAPDAKPDLFVMYSAGIKQNVSWQGYRTGLFMGMGSISQNIENEGTLVVDLAGPQQKMILWRGMSEQTLSDKSEKNIEKVQKMIAKMFAKYPPGQ